MATQTPKAKATAKAPEKAPTAFSIDQVKAAIFGHFGGSEAFQADLWKILNGGTYEVRSATDTTGQADKAMVWTPKTDFRLALDGRNLGKGDQRQGVLHLVKVEEAADKDGNPILRVTTMGERFRVNDTAWKDPVPIYFGRPHQDREKVQNGPDLNGMAPGNRRVFRLVKGSYGSLSGGTGATLVRVKDGSLVRPKAEGSEEG